MEPLYAALSRVVPSGHKLLYRNPVQSGDFPDPTVIRVGDRDFYAACTSTDWAPEFPIFHSRDLVSWTRVASVFCTRPAWSVGNFWAPEFAHYGNRYYVYYVARQRDGPLCIAVASAAHPAGPYTDHGPLVGQNHGSIDPMATVDTDGRRWLIWKEDGNSVYRPTPIWAQRLTDDGLSLIGEKHELIRNDAAWEDEVVEAPVIFRRDGWFYLLYSGNACCGPDCAYAVGVARSRELLGPWEKCPRNPIIAGNDQFRCPGHGSVTTDAAGNMYFLYHAYALEADSLSVGRQMILDRVAWSADGWPTVNDGRGPSGTALTPFPRAQVRKAPMFFDDFTSRELTPGWQWPQGTPPIMTIDRHHGGSLVVSSRAGSGVCDTLDAVFAQPVETGDFSATTAVALTGRKADAVISLTAYGDRRNAVGIGIRNASIVLWRRKRGKIVVAADVALPTSASVHLRMTVRAGYVFHFAFSPDGKRWEEIGAKVDGAHLPPWDRGIRVALTVGGVTGAQGRFDYLRIRPIPRRHVVAIADRRGSYERQRLRMRRVSLPPPRQLPVVGFKAN